MYILRKSAYLMITSATLSVFYTRNKGHMRQLAGANLDILNKQFVEIVDHFDVGNDAGNLQIEENVVGTQYTTPHSGCTHLFSIQIKFCRIALHGGNKLINKNAWNTNTPNIQRTAVQRLGMRCSALACVYQ